MHLLHTVTARRKRRKTKRKEEKSVGRTVVGANAHAHGDTERWGRGRTALLRDPLLREARAHQTPTYASKSRARSRKRGDACGVRSTYVRSARTLHKTTKSNLKFTTRDKQKHHETVSQKRANLSLSTSSNAGKSLSSWLYDAQACHMNGIINHDTPPNQEGRGTSERRRAHTGKGRTWGRPGVKRQENTQRKRRGGEREIEI